MATLSPFRDLGAAYEHIEHLSRENAAPRARLAPWRFDWILWTLATVILLCVIAITYVFAATR
jgi:hypothetical protein